MSLIRRPPRPRSILSSPSSIFGSKIEALERYKSHFGMLERDADDSSPIHPAFGEHMDKLQEAKEHLRPRLALMIKWHKEHVVEGKDDLDIETMLVGSMARTHTKTGRVCLPSKNPACYDFTLEELRSMAAYLDTIRLWTPLLSSSSAGKPANALTLAYRRKVRLVFEEAASRYSVEDRFNEIMTALGSPPEKVAELPATVELKFLQRLTRIRSSKPNPVFHDIRIIQWVEDVVGRHMVDLLLVDSASSSASMELLEYLQTNTKGIVEEIDGGASVVGSAESDVDVGKHRRALKQMAQKWIANGMEKPLNSATGIANHLKHKIHDAATAMLKQAVLDAGVDINALPTSSREIYLKLPSETFAEARGSIARIPELFGEIIKLQALIKKIFAEVCLRLSHDREGRAIGQI